MWKEKQERKEKGKKRVEEISQESSSKESIVGKQAEIYLASATAKTKDSHDQAHDRHPFFPHDLPESMLPCHYAQVSNMP